VPVGERGHLGQVGHHEHLVGPGQPGQPATDLHRRPAAHARVDLVEHQRRRATGAGEHHLDGQHHPGQLAPGGALLQRQRRSARVGQQLQLDLVGTVGGDAGLGTGDDQRRVTPPGGPGGDRDLYPRVRHGQPDQLDGDRVGEPRRRLQPGRPDLRGQLGDLAGHPLPFPVQLLQQLVGGV